MSRSIAVSSLRGVPLAALILAASVSAGGLVAYTTLAKAEVNPSQERYITQCVTQLMAQQHFTKHPFDSEINRRWLTNFLKLIDRRKLFFMQSDVDEFMKSVDQLDDMARAGDTSFAHKVYKRYLERLDERMKLVDDLVAMPQDFTIDEEMITDMDQVPYAKTEAEMRDRWRKRIKFEFLELAVDQPRPENRPGASSNKPGKLEGKAAEEKIAKRYHHIARRMKQTDNDDLLEMYLTALTTSYDPHTSYMSPTTLEDFEIQMRLNLEGIGAALEDADGETVVKKIIPGGAAAKDGRLKPDDRIVGVGQNVDGPIVNVDGMRLRDVVKMIRGHQGTTVRLAVVSKGETDSKIYPIVRQQVELSDQEARGVIMEAGRKPDGSIYKVGIINLPSFYMDMDGSRVGRSNFKSATRDVSKLLKDFNKEKVDVVVMDLSHNGGGSLIESIKLTGLFIDNGCVVQVKDSDGQKSQFDDTERGAEWTGPLVVLTSKYSASASEIFAGAVQDYQRGIIVGDTSTHGKGTVQSLLDIGQKLFDRANRQKLGALKVTENQFYRPDGDSTQNRGVIADVELPSLSSHFDIGESSLDYALKFDRVEAVPHERCGLVDNQLLKELRDRSADRRKESKDFRILDADIKEFDAQKQKKRISLNKEKFNAEMAELKAEKHEEEEFEDINDPNRPVFKRTFYNSEVLAIATDYARLMSTSPAPAVGQR